LTDYRFKYLSGWFGPVIAERERVLISP
jgi:hypothetical protein